MSSPWAVQEFSDQASWRKNYCIFSVASNFYWTEAAPYLGLVYRYLHSAPFTKSSKKHLFKWKQSCLKHHVVFTRTCLFNMAGFIYMPLLNTSDTPTKRTLMPIAQHFKGCIKNKKKKKTVDEVMAEKTNQHDYYILQCELEVR